MQVTASSEEIQALENRLLELQLLMSAMALLMKDDKGKIRINKNIINKVNAGKIENIDWHTNAAGAVIMEVSMA